MKIVRVIVEFLKWAWQKFLDYIYVLPPIQVLVMALISLIELNCFLPNETLAELGYNYGSSSFTLAFYVGIIFNDKYKYCLFSKFMVVALIINHILYKLGQYVSSDVYQKWYTLTAFTVVSMAFVIYYYQTEKKKWKLTQKKQ